MTSHASPESSPPDSSDRGAWEWWLAVLLGLAAAFFGMYGLWLYEVANREPVDWGSIGYHTLQLFTLHAPHLDHDVPWQLNVGRWLSAVVVLGAVARGLTTVFWSECRLISARLWGNHVVVCGLGRTGSHLAKEFRHQGSRVVAIDNASGAEHIAEAYRSGVAIIKGDACDPEALRTAGVDSAVRVLATCDDDQKNVAIAVRVGELLKEQKSRKNLTECWLFIRDGRLREKLRRDSLFPNTGKIYNVNVRGLDIFELGARSVLWRVPLDYQPIRPADATAVRLVIVGFGSVGQQLALQAARIGHFANFRKLRLTVLESRGSQMVDGFLARHPKIEEVCDFNRVQVDMVGGQFDPETAIRAIPPEAEKDLLTVAACWESPNHSMHDRLNFFEALGQDDAANLELALALSEDRSRYPQVLVFQSQKTGFGSLFPILGRGAAIGPQFFPFGMMEDTLSMETLLHEREDEIAKALHGDYYEKQLAKGNQPGSCSACFPWEQLPERFRESNRRAGDHVGVKLRAMGYTMRKFGSDIPPVTSFDHEAFKDKVALTAEMEHRSWCAELMLQNWSYAPGKRNELAKTHPSLVPWEKLDDGTKKYDFDQVKIIPTALRNIGFGIYPLSS